MWRRFSFAAVETTKVRVLTQDSADGYSPVTEVEAWGGGGAAAQGAEVRWLVADQLGTPRMVVDATGMLAGISRHDYLPFGEELSAGTGGRVTGQGYGAVDNVRQKFTGYERDEETKLDFAQARYYANAQGRFTGVDPLSMSGKPGQPQSWNRYAYCLNNPLVYVDPTGLIWGQRDLGNGTSQFQWFKDEAALKAAGKSWTETTNFLVRNLKGGWFALNRFAGTYENLSDYAVAAGLFNGATAYRMAGLSSPLFQPQERLTNAVDDIMKSDTMRWVMNDRGVQGALLAMGVFSMSTGATGRAAASAGTADEGMLTLFHGSTKNASHILNSGLDVGKSGATYVSTDVAAAKNAIAYRMTLGEATDFGVITSRVPRGDYQALINSGAVRVRPYTGFYPYTLNTVEHLLLTPEAKELFNKGIQR